MHNSYMPNIASILKAEISRIARKESRSEVESIRKAVSAQRAEIAALKRRVQEMEKAIKAFVRASGRAKASKPSTSSVSEDNEGLRFRAAGMASNRKRLGLSAADFGLLVGATGQSVYSWESGRSRP